MPIHRAMGNILETIWNVFKKSVTCGIFLFLVFLGHGFDIPCDPDCLSKCGSLQNLSYLELAATYVNASIYWVWHDALFINQLIFGLWSKICSPIYKFGLVFVSVLIAQNFWFQLKGTILKNKLSVYCPIDNLPGRPIPGTVDRYRCHNGHQFAGEPHDFHHI